MAKSIVEANNGDISVKMEKMVRFLKLNFTLSLKSHFNPLLLRQIEGRYIWKLLELKTYQKLMEVEKIL